MEDNDEPTRFVESNALLAVDRDDEHHARELLRTMYLHELSSFSTTLSTLSDLVDEEMGRR